MRRLPFQNVRITRSRFFLLGDQVFRREQAFSRRGVAQIGLGDLSLGDLGDPAVMAELTAEQREELDQLRTATLATLVAAGQSTSRQVG